MQKFLRWFVPALLVVAGAVYLAGQVAVTGAGSAYPEIAIRDLPAEARETLALIKKGGPFPYERDGVVFGNYEKILPRQPKGYYREYTVKTPGARNRGARRIVAGSGSGGDVRTSGEYWYTADHYKSFSRVREDLR